MFLVNPSHCGNNNLQRGIKWKETASKSFFAFLILLLHNSPFARHVKGCIFIMPQLKLRLS